MFSNREFVCQNLITLLISGIVIGFEFYIPTWMQGITGTNASIAGFAVTPSSVMWIVGSFLSGTLMVKWGVRRLFDGALSLILIADIALLMIPTYTPFWVFCLLAAINGLGFGTIITASTVRSQLLAGPENLGLATSFNTLMRYLGQTMMISVYGIVFNLSVAHHLSQKPNLTEDMMNKIVSSVKAKQLSVDLIPQLRLVLHQALQSIYLTSLIVIIIALLLNQGYRRQKQDAEDQA